MILIPINSKPLISRYRLKSKAYLNSISNRREFEGALIQVEGGFGCIHPWPELGDPSLEKCLADLSGGRHRSIVRRALRCAEYDRACRDFENSLFEEMEIPVSHATLADYKPAEVALAVEAGFTVAKVKVGRQPESETMFLDSMAVEYPQLAWRLDFNESLAPDAAVEFLLGLAAKTRKAIDFVEDPCPYSESTWQDVRRRTGLNLAVDREASPTSSAARRMVIKPAVDEPFLLGETAIQYQQRVVVTSYMDHPLGQAFAAWEAARLELQFPGLVDTCGLQTHHLFEPNEFSEILGPWSPQFTPPPGTGLGFDDLLQALPWTRLY